MKYPQRIKIVNLNYFYAEPDKLVRSTRTEAKPWAVFRDGMIGRHRTHAKALRHACKLAKKRGKK